MDKARHAFGFLLQYCSLILVACSLILVSSFNKSAKASDQELFGLAQELSAASIQLAKEHKYSQGSSGLSQRASRLARETLQFIDAIQRRRNPSNVRSQFKDVSERYSDLEDVFWRGYRNDSDATVFEQVELIGDIYYNLQEAYYRSGYYQAPPQVFIFADPNLPLGQNYVDSSGDRSAEASASDRNSPDSGTGPEANQKRYVTPTGNRQRFKVNP